MKNIMDWTIEELEVIVAPVVATVGTGSGAKSVIISADG